MVDSGYASLSGFLTPFKGEQYHLNDYRGVEDDQEQQKNYLTIGTIH